MKFKLIFIGFVVSACATAGEISGIDFSFPEGIEFNQITNTKNGNMYLKEWIPDGKSTENTDWIIVQQKFNLERKTNAKKYLGTILDLSQKSCTDVKFNGPEKRNLEKIDSYWARLMCAQVISKDYGTITEFRVISMGSDIYIVTSEVKLSPTKKAGMFEFKTKTEMDKFMEKLEISANLARNQVRVCKENSCE